MIRSFKTGDARDIAEIYNYFIKNTAVTFEEAEITEREIKTRVHEVTHSHLPWLVYEKAGTVVGYAYAAQWKSRSAYRQSVEITIYLSPANQACGIGSELYQALFLQLEKRPLHAVLGCITLPNAASIALHEKFGMKKVAHFAEVGYKFGKRLDVGYWQRLLIKD